MRFAAIADIHGNHLALDAVLADIRAQGIDDIVNLGDMASGALDARRPVAGSGEGAGFPIPAVQRMLRLVDLVGGHPVEEIVTGVERADMV